MTHDQHIEESMALADGELTGERRSAAETHLAGCPECRTATAAWREAGALLKTPQPAASEAFVTRVMAEVRAAEGRRVSVGDRILRWLLPTVAIASFAGFVAVVVQPAEAPASTETVLYSEVEDQMPTTWFASASGSSDASLDTLSEEI